MTDPAAGYDAWPLRILPLQTASSLAVCCESVELLANRLPMCLILFKEIRYQSMVRRDVQTNQS